MLHIRPSPCQARQARQPREALASPISQRFSAVNHLDAESQVWFLQAQAQFHLHRITSQTTQYYNVISSLSSEIVNDLTDILAQPLGENPFEHLKKKILTRNVFPKCTRLQQLTT
ncbi:hypothetical protein HPB49_021512 [Dermacentor silvarum]|uniref:Uncharacterized protein n=1 Tax=Dermacentor silvarum TaxID=543639 RepID=A0ACB8CZM5_DERSI|nr:hypothetical protein HPB49_021512 [Dermacentor silvarum]